MPTAKAKSKALSKQHLSNVIKIAINERSKRRRTRRRRREERKPHPQQQPQVIVLNAGGGGGSGYTRGASQELAALERNLANQLVNNTVAPQPQQQPPPRRGVLGNLFGQAPPAQAPPAQAPPTAPPAQPPPTAPPASRGRSFTTLRIPTMSSLLGALGPSATQEPPPNNDLSTPSIDLTSPQGKNVSFQEDTNRFSPLRWSPLVSPSEYDLVRWRNEDSSAPTHRGGGGRGFFADSPDLSPITWKAHAETQTSPATPVNQLAEQALSATDFSFSPGTRADIAKQRMIDYMLDNNDFAPLERQPSQHHRTGVRYTRLALERLTTDKVREKYEETKRNVEENRVVDRPRFEGGGGGAVALRDFSTLTDAELAQELAEAVANAERYGGVYALEQHRDKLREELERRRHRR